MLSCLALFCSTCLLQETLPSIVATRNPAATSTNFGHASSDLYPLASSISAGRDPEKSSIIIKLDFVLSRQRVCGWTMSLSVAAESIINGPAVLSVCMESQVDAKPSHSAAIPRSLTPKKTLIRTRPLKLLQACINLRNLGGAECLVRALKDWSTTHHAIERVLRFAQ